MFAFQRLCVPARSRYALFFALFLAVLLFFLVPGVTEAHAVLIRSDPAKDAILASAPHRVRLWFSEALNTSLSTAAIVDEAQTNVDLSTSHVLVTDPTEMDLALTATLKPAVYLVSYRSVANDDGHILTGSFPFTVALPDGMLPQPDPGSKPVADAVGTSSLNGPSTGLVDGMLLLNLLTITLVEAGAVFYVGAAIWHLFVLRSPIHADAGERARERFAKHLSVPLVAVMFIANTGVLIGQALTMAGGNWSSAVTPALLITLSTSGRFGFFWLLREVVLVLAWYLALVQEWQRSHFPRFAAVFPWIQLLLGLTFFFALTMSSHAAAASPDHVMMALLADYLHLIAAALWIGGMLYLALSYLPAQRKQPIATQAQALLTVLRAYSPFAAAGVLIMAVTGPLSATIHLTSWAQVFTTAYGLALAAKVALVGGLLVTSAVHVLLLRPRVQNAYQAYGQTTSRVLEAEQVAVGGARAWNGPQAVSPAMAARLASESVECAERLMRDTSRLCGVLRFEPILGVAVLVCVGLMNVFAGSLSPTGAVAPHQPSAASPPVLHLAARTADNRFLVGLDIAPCQIGANTFLAQVEDAATGTAVTTITVSLSISSLDMDMGTTTIDLQPDGKGQFRNTGDLTMGGNWHIHIQIRTPDNTVHDALVKFQISSSRG